MDGAQGFLTDLTNDVPCCVRAKQDLLGRVAARLTTETVRPHEEPRVPKSLIPSPIQKTSRLVKSLIP